MTLLRRLKLSLVAACAALALTASPSMAVVGGHDAPAGAYPSIADVPGPVDQAIIAVPAKAGTARRL